MKLNTYTTEFKAEAVRMVLDQGLSVEEGAQRLSIPKGTLGNWVTAARKGVGTTVAPGSRSVADLEAEVMRLRKELAESNLEREILKKATAYFARESLPGTRK